MNHTPKTKKKPRNSITFWEKDKDKDKDWEEAEKGEMGVPCLVTD